MISWLRENKEALKAVKSLDELAALLNQNGFDVSADELTSLAAKISNGPLDDEALSAVSGGVSGRTNEVEAFLNGLLARSWEIPENADSLVYRGQPYELMTLETRGKKRKTTQDPQLRSL